MIETTFGMVKPEGLRYAEDIEERILNIGLKIEEKRKLILNENQFEKIYGHVRGKIPNIYGFMKDYMTLNEVIIFKVTGEEAIEKLLELRGCSNASDAKPGTIRGDYAKDQDYKNLYAQGKLAKNVFHASDVQEAVGMVDNFFGDKK